MTSNVRRARRFLAGPNATLVVGCVSLILLVTSLIPDITGTTTAWGLIGAIPAVLFFTLQALRPFAAEAPTERPAGYSPLPTTLLEDTLASGAAFDLALAALIDAHEDLRTAPTDSSHTELLTRWNRRNGTITRARQAADAHDTNLRNLRFDHQIGDIPIDHRSLLRRITDSHDNGLRTLGHTRRFYDTPWQGPGSRDSESR